jgi:hypothetical protein
MVLSVHVPTEDKLMICWTAPIRNCNVHSVSSPNNMENVLGDFSAKEDTEHIFKPTVRSENLYEIDNDNGV